MPRPLIPRRVCCWPQANYFKPKGIPLDMLKEVNLTLDELEAIRLADLEGLYQEEAAQRMGISRQTFANILDSAHRKIADALLNGKALKIEGGVVEMAERHFVCYSCKHTWSVPYGTPRPSECPQCKSTNIHRAPEDRGWARAGWGRGRGRCWRLNG